MSEIKHIIFDLGGVILNIDYQLTIDAFKKIGFTNFKNFYSKKQQVPIFDAFETGKLSIEKFRNSIKNNCPVQITNTEIDASWNAMLLDLPLKRIKLIENLSSKYNVFLLSNTNELHIKAFKSIIDKSFTYKRFENAFKHCLYSSEIGLRKPNSNCFLYVLDTYDLNPSETLFIDDSKQHILGADSLGIQTYHLKENEEITRVVPDIIQSKRHL